jgi:hypothetical protein
VLVTGVVRLDRLDWERLDRLDWETRDVLARLLKPYLRSEDVSRPRKTTTVDVIDLISFGPSAALVIVHVSFSAGDPEVRLLPLAIEEDKNVAAREQRVIARVQSDATEPIVLCAGVANSAMSNALLELSGSREHQAQTGRLRGVGLPHVTPLRNAPGRLPATAFTYRWAAECLIAPGWGFCAEGL